MRSWTRASSSDAPAAGPGAAGAPRGKTTSASPIAARDTAPLRRHRGLGSVVVGVLILGATAVIALGAPLLAPRDPTRIAMLERLRPPSWAGGKGGYLLGTDHLGRDVLSRTVYGARVSLLVGASAVLGSGALGVTLGLLAGYVGGRFDDAVMRLADVQQSFPYLALAIAVVGILGPGLGKLILVLAVTGWVLYARVVRAEVLGVREHEFVEAAHALGVSDLGIMARHVLPNIRSSVIIVATFNFAYFIVAEASLTFLGLGLDPSTPSWGMMLSDSRNYLHVAWWYPTVPGTGLMLTVMAANLLGDGLRDLWDPRMRASE